MIAIIFMMESKYDCNLNSQSDNIGLQFFKRTKYDCNHRKYGFARFVRKSLSRDSRMIFDIAIVFSPFWKRLQSFMVVLGAEIAIIFGPDDRNHCNHRLSSPIRAPLIGNFWSKLECLRIFDRKRYFFKSKMVIFVSRIFEIQKSLLQLIFIILLICASWLEIQMKNIEEYEKTLILQKMSERLWPF